MLRHTVRSASGAASGSSSSVRPGASLARSCNADDGERGFVARTPPKRHFAAAAYAAKSSRALVKPAVVPSSSTSPLIPPLHPQAFLVQRAYATSTGKEKGKRKEVRDGGSSGGITRPGDQLAANAKGAFPAPSSDAKSSSQKGKRAPAVSSAEASTSAGATSVVASQADADSVAAATQVGSSDPGQQQQDAAAAAAAADQAAEQQPSFTTSSSVRFAKEDKMPLPLLSAPLGVQEAPSSHKLTWAERREQQFDYDRRMAKRKAIVKEATRGYFHDFHAIRSHGGKTWRAPSTMIRQDRALYFPGIQGTSLADKQKTSTADLLYGKVSVVCFLTSQMSEQHTKSFYEPTLEMYRGDANFQLVQINLQENVLKAYLVALFVSMLRKQIPAELHATYLLSHQGLTTEREAIRLDNKHVGYTYLVGPDGKIRWAGCGFADRDERQALVACTGVLLSRSSSSAGVAAGASAGADPGGSVRTSHSTSASIAASTGTSAV